MEPHAAYTNTLYVWTYVRHLSKNDILKTAVILQGKPYRPKDLIAMIRKTTRVVAASAQRRPGQT